MKRSHKNIVAGLDIGSSAIRLVVGEFAPSESGRNETELHIIGLAETPSAGVHRGVINSIDDAVSSISDCLEKAERMIGMPIPGAWTGMAGSHIISQTSKGVVAVSKADNEIAEEDVERALDASQAIATPLNYEVLHVLPKSFSIDGQGKVKDPVGMTGMRLEVDSHIILASSSHMKNLTRAVYRTGLNIDDLVLSVLATAEAVVTARQREIGVLVVNIGLSTTSIAVFEEGDLLHTAILPIGAEHITNDIAIGLRTTIDIAEAVKIEHGDCRTAEIQKREEIDLYELGAPDHETVKKQYVSEIIEARVEEILHKIDQELVKIKRSGLLPAGAVFTGGGAKLPGLIDVAKRELRLPVVLGYPMNVLSVTDKVNDLAFSTAVGLVMWGGKMAGASGRKNIRSSRPSDQFNRASSQLKKWIKTLIP